MIASDVLFIAYAEGDIADKVVADLGCGTGILAIGAGKLGARRVIGIDVDGNALSQAEANAKHADVVIDFLRQDVTEFGRRWIRLS